MALAEREGAAMDRRRLRQEYAVRARCIGRPLSQQVRAMHFI